MVLDQLGRVARTAFDLFPDEFFRFGQQINALMQRQFANRYIEDVTDKEVADCLYVWAGRFGRPQ